MKGEFYYNLAMDFCVRNNIEMAHNCLRKAAKKGHKKAKVALQEIEELVMLKPISFCDG